MLCILKAGSLSASFNLHSWERPVISPPKAKVFSLSMAPFKFLPTPLERAEWPQHREGPEQPAFSRCWPGCKTSPKTVKHPQRRAVKKEKEKKDKGPGSDWLPGCILNISSFRFALMLQYLGYTICVRSSRVLHFLAFFGLNHSLFCTCVSLRLPQYVASFPAALHSLWILAKEGESELKV